MLSSTENLGSFGKGTNFFELGDKKKITFPLTFYLEKNQEDVPPFPLTEYNLSLSNQRRMSLRLEVSLTARGDESTVIDTRAVAFYLRRAGFI